MDHVKVQNCNSEMAADVSPSEVEMYQGAAKIEGILNYATHLPNAVSMRSISFLKPVSSTLLLFLVALPGTSDSVWRIVARSKSTIIGRLQVEFHSIFRNSASPWSTPLE